MSSIIFKVKPLSEEGDTCFNIDSLTIQSKNIMHNSYFHLPLVTSIVDSSPFLKIKVHDQPLTPKIKL